MRSYQSYSDSDLRFFKATATKINTFNCLTRRQQFDGKYLILNDRYKKTDTINNQQPVNKANRSISLTKINFIYHQPVHLKQLSLDKYTQRDKLQQKLVQNKKDKFMKVISKNYIPKDVLTFVYGKQSPQSINHPHSIETHRSSFNTKMGQQQSHYRASSNRDKIVYDRIGVKNGLMSNGQGLEYFPVSKIKRSRKSSSRKSSQSELQLLDNCKSQLVKQQYKTLMLMQNRNDKNEQELKETQVQNRTTQQRQTQWIQRQDKGLNKAGYQNDNNNKNNNNDYDDKLTQQQQSKDQINQHNHNDQAEQINHFNNNSYSQRSQREQEWNNTIKFNHIHLNSNINTNINTNKLQQTNHSSHFNKNNTVSTFNNTNFTKSSAFDNSTGVNTNTNNDNNESPFTQQDYNKKNHTQKISEFILCDQQIGKEQNPFKTIQQNPFKTNTKCHQFCPSIQQLSQECPQIKDTLQGNNNNTNQNDLNNSLAQNNIDQSKNRVYQNNYLFQQYTFPGQHNKRNIPVFQIKLSDLQKEKDLQLTKDLQKEKEKDIQFQNIQTPNQNNQNHNEQSIKEQQKILHNIQTSDTLAGLRQSQNNNNHIQQNFQIYDRLQSSIQQLGKNIGDLSGKISTINAVKNGQSKISITSIKNKPNKQKKLGLSSNCYSQKVVTVINNNNFDDKKQNDNQINKLFNDDDNNNLYQENNKEEIKIVDEYVRQEDKDKDVKNLVIVQNHGEQIGQHNNDSHLIDGMSQNEFLNYSYSRQLKQHQHFELNGQQSQGQPSQIKTIHHQNHVLGSLEIIDHQTSLMVQSLHNIYANSQGHSIYGQKQRHCQKHDTIEDNLIYQQNSNIMPQQQQNQRHVHFEDYDEKDQQKFNQQYDNIPQQRQQKSLTQNFFNKLQRQRRIRQFYGVKTFQKTRSKSQMQKSNKNHLHKQYQNGSNNFQNKTFNNKNYQRQSKLFQSKGLNYQMYKTYRDKSLSKRYTLLGVDHRKQRLIQLPYMDRPFDMKLNGESIRLPKYIKSKVYYVKG